MIDYAYYKRACSNFSSLLFIGSAFDIITSGISAAFGVVALAAGMMGWFVKKVGIWERIVLLIAAFLLIKPGLYTDAAGYVLLLVIYIRQKYFTKKAKEVALARIDTG